MGKTTPRLYKSALFENDDLQQTLEKKMKEVYSFINSFINIKAVVTYFNDRDPKSKRKHKIYKTHTSISESIDTVVINGATTTSVTLSITDVGLTVVPISADIPCTLSLGNIVIHKIFIDKNNKYIKQLEEINKLLNVLKNFVGKTYKIVYLIKENMNLYTSIKILMKKRNFFL